MVKTVNRLSCNVTAHVTRTFFFFFCCFIVPPTYLTWAFQYLPLASCLLSSFPLFSFFFFSRVRLLRSKSFIAVQLIVFLFFKLLVLFLLLLRLFISSSFFFLLLLFSSCASSFLFSFYCFFFFDVFLSQLLLILHPSIYIVTHIYIHTKKKT